MTSVLFLAAVAAIDLPILLQARHLILPAISSSRRDRRVAPHVLMELLGCISLASGRHNIMQKSDSCPIYNLGRRSGMMVDWWTRPPVPK